MIFKIIAKLIGLENPWPIIERMTSIMDAEYIHENNKKKINTLILTLSFITTILISYIISLYSIYMVNIIPLFLLVVVLTCLCVFKQFMEELYSVILSVSFTYIICAIIYPFIDYDISPILALAFTTILIISAHIWNYLLKDLDKNLYPITKAGANHLFLTEKWKNINTS